MARTAFNLKAQIFEVVCHDEADGIGDAEPYLWPVFFKIDGDSYAVDSVGLIGFPTVISTNGDHGNLGDTDVDEGDTVRVPEAVGTRVMPLKPIPVNDPSFRIVIGDDLPGIAGVVVVLMEEDSWPNDLAVTGYKALVDAVQLGVARAAASFQHAAAAPTPDEIDEQIAGVKDLASRMVTGAILEHMSVGQIGWYGTVGNNDDKIGSEAFTVTQDDFNKDNHIKTFLRRWDNDESDGNGDWSITVSFVNLDAPPPDEDPTKCARLAEQIAQLREELREATDINERKRILQAIGQLRGEAAHLGCPGF
ncbi:MAG: hypothetical protein M3444_09210 [Acidobacteriota bacterium]|nr:hypothetical protein [Acidobacteriota bacterium]MDQ5839177.1 hypothetical protein [Acidobacteriota bacterium]